MKSIYRITLFSFLVISPLSADQPVFKNPGILEESFEITDLIDCKTGYVTAEISVSVKKRNSEKYYSVKVNEGNLFLNEIEINYYDLTTISEKRTDLKTNKIIEIYSNNGSNLIHFFNAEKKIKKNFTNSSKNIYSRYAYFISFRGFPFNTSKSVKFITYMAEYGNALTMEVKNIARIPVTVKAGTFDCYKLELCVSGWQSIFSSDKFYLYFSVNSPHQFIKYEEKDGDKWNANELIRIIK